MRFSHVHQNSTSVWRQIVNSGPKFHTSSPSAVYPAITRWTSWMRSMSWCRRRGHSGTMAMAWTVAWTTSAVRRMNEPEAQGFYSKTGGRYTCVWLLRGRRCRLRCGWMTVETLEFCGWSWNAADNDVISCHLNHVRKENPFVMGPGAEPRLFLSNISEIPSLIIYLRFW